MNRSVIIVDHSHFIASWHIESKIEELDRGVNLSINVIKIENLNDFIDQKKHLLSLLGLRAYATLEEVQREIKELFDMC